MQESDDYEDSDGKCASNDKGCNDLVKRIEIKKQKEKERNWFGEFLRDKNTPIIMATVQEIAAAVGEVAVIVTVFQPELAPVGAAVFTAGWLVGRAASALGTAATTTQYNENLHGTNGIDMYISWGTTLAGLNPAWASASSTVNFLYTAIRTAGGELGDVPWIFPREE